MALSTTTASALAAAPRPAAPQPPVQVLLLRGVYLGGQAHKAGAVVTVPADVALMLVSSNKASRNVPARAAAKAPPKPTADTEAAAPPATAKPEN